jgi:hypothetical protein
MTRLDGKFIKPGSIPEDRLDPTILLGGGGVPDGSITPQKLAAALLAKFVIVAWGDAVDVDPTTRSLTLQLKDLLGDDIPAAHVLRLTCDERASMSIGDQGEALSGDESSDCIARTNASGRLDLIVTCNQPLTVSLAVGPTQSSPMLDCRTGANVVFT